MVLGLILARGGSKRIPRKNLRELNHTALIHYTLSAATEAKCFDEIVVSSDDDEILERSKFLWRVETLKRPAEMATDEAPPYPAILHALDRFPAEHVCLLQPTSPFRTAFDINFTLAMYFLHHANSMASAEFGKIVPNGAIYIGRADWLKNGGIWDERNGFGPGLCFMPPARSLDIDTEEDWAKAEALLGVAT